MVTNTLSALHLQTLHKNAHKKRESLKRVRVRVARSYAKKKNEKGHPKGLLRLTSALPPKSLPNHYRATGGPRRGDPGPGLIRSLRILVEWYQSLARAPPVESCAQPATDIESYLYPSSTGRVAAQIGHARAHGVRTVKIELIQHRIQQNSCITRYTSTTHGDTEL